MKNKFSIFNFKFSVKSAFTLLEMLVVIGIIGILVGMGAVSYSTAQKKARDAKRKQDLKAIQNAFEQYYSICNYKYPAAVPAAGRGLIAQSGICPNVSSNVLIFTMPADPLGGNYSCLETGTCNESGYTICSPLVSGTSRLETQTCPDSSGNKSECCVSNQQ
jgi:prepilin-type N-terminal cleavage/methylation domain-containing protein